MKNTLMMAVLLVALLGCGGPTIVVTAAPGTPSHALQRFIKAVHEGDVEAYYGLMQESARVPALQALAARPDLVKPRTLEDMAKASAKLAGATVENEKIEGNTATVVLKQRDGTTFNMSLVKEADGWKLKLK
jgi:hypothetical protein